MRLNRKELRKNHLAGKLWSGEQHEKAPRYAKNRQKPPLEGTKGPISLASSTVDCSTVSRQRVNID
jgi:hypothetical protein